MNESFNSQVAIAASSKSSGKLQIFISWSGSLAHDVAKQLAKWIPRVIQDTKPWMSPTDIEKGKFWQRDLINTLQESTVGIAIITPANANQPWLNFEVGALARAVNPYDAIVMPLLINMGLTDVDGPIQTLQLTRFEKADFFMLMQSINSRVREPLDGDFLQQEYDEKWPDLEKRVEDVIAQAVAKDGANAKPLARPQHQILEDLASEIYYIRHEVEAAKKYNSRPDTSDFTERLVDYLRGTLIAEGLFMTGSTISMNTKSSQQASIELKVSGPFDEDATERALEKLSQLGIKVTISGYPQEHELDTH